MIFTLTARSMRKSVPLQETGKEGITVGSEEDRENQMGEEEEEEEQRGQMEVEERIMRLG